MQNHPALRLVVRALMLCDKPIGGDPSLKRHEVIRMTIHILPQTFQRRHLIAEAPPLQSRPGRSNARFADRCSTSRRRCRHRERPQHHHPRTGKHSEKQPVLAHSHPKSLLHPAPRRHPPNGPAATRHRQCWLQWNAATECRVPHPSRLCEGWDVIRHRPCSRRLEPFSCRSMPGRGPRALLL